ncbi:MAG: hypothetical protein U1D06_08230, partial [Paracoccaceae bacterium]|nr:hypothetical protein [Paracoccaceae bacterium]
MISHGVFADHPVWGPDPGSGCHTFGIAGNIVILPHSFSSRAVGRQAHLRIIETTDLHAHILPY